MDMFDEGQNSQFSVVGSLLLLGMAALFVAACGLPASKDAPAQGLPNPGGGAMVTGKDALPPAHTGDPKVVVTLRDFEIEAPAELKPGYTIFNVTNGGNLLHNFHVTGPGVDQKFDAELQPTEMRYMIIDLKPGTYRIACTVGTEEKPDMVKQFTVKASGSDSAKP